MSSLLEDTPRATTPHQPVELHEPEIVNSLTHGLGAVLAVVGAIVLLAAAASRGDAWYLAACVIYSISLVAVYLASTASHVFRHPVTRVRMRMLDQGAIYLLIAGTFTPFGLVYLRSGWWWLLIGVMWAAALVGFVSKVILAHRLHGVSVWLYVLMGWLPVIAYQPVLRQAHPAALWLLFAGGMCYTVGTLFLIADWKRYHFHGIWHVLVIAGSTLHFVAIYSYVGLPAGI